ATTRRPNAEARNRTANGYIEASASLMKQRSDPLIAHKLIHTLYHAGALEQVTTLVPLAQIDDDYRFILKAALTTANVAVATEAAAHEPTEFEYAEETQRGALLCLLGRKEEGLRALARADTKAREDLSTPDGDADAHLAMVACGKAET